jgi:hypothetical protein
VRACLNSSHDFSPNIDNIIYPKPLSKTLESTEGIFIFLLTTSFTIISFSQALNISNFTFVHAGHLILVTASFTVIFLRSIQLDLIIISQDNNHASLAGEPAIILSIETQKSFFSITAHIHSKSQLRVSLNFLVSSILKNSECLSLRDSTNHFIIQYTISFSEIFLNQ